MTKHINKTQAKLKSLVRLVSHHYLIKDSNVIKIALAGVAAHHFETDPLWIFLIAPASSMKTEYISALDDISDIYQLSSLTPQTLFSGLRKTKGQTKDNALLTKIGDKILTLKDFGTVLSMRHEDRAIVLAQLREVYDGKFHARYGNGVEIDWQGRMGFIAGATEAIDTHYSIFQILGERFLQFRLNPLNETELGEIAIDNLGSEKVARQKIRESFAMFFNQLEIPSIKDMALPGDIKDCLVNLACFCVRARSGTVRDHYRKSLEYVPAPEAPARLAKQLATLAYALAIIEGRKKVSYKDYLLVLKVGLDCIPRQRMAVLNSLAGKGKELTTAKVGEAIDYSTEGARRHLEDLSAHKIITINKEGRDHTWKLSKITNKFTAKMLPDKLKEQLKTIKKAETTGQYYKKFFNHLLEIHKEEGGEENNTTKGGSFSKRYKKGVIGKEEQLVRDMPLEEVKEVFSGRA